MARSWLAVFLLAASACGGDSSPGGGGSGSNIDAHGITPDVGNYDFGCAGGSACSLSSVCCASPSANTTFACAAPGSCPAPDEILCAGPSECGGGTPVCCAVYMADGTGSYPSCGIATLGTSCTSAAACPTHLENSCTDTTKVQLCKVKADCTDSTNNQCCTFASGAASLTFCIDSTTAALGHGTCH